MSVISVDFVNGRRRDDQNGLDSPTMPFDKNGPRTESVDQAGGLMSVVVPATLPDGLVHVQAGMNSVAYLFDLEPVLASVDRRGYDMKPVEGQDDAYCVGGMGIGDFSRTLNALFFDKVKGTGPAFTAEVAQRMYGAYGLGRLLLGSLIGASVNRTRLLGAMVTEYRQKENESATSSDAATIIINRTAATMALVSVRKVLGTPEKASLSLAVQRQQFPSKDAETIKAFTAHTRLLPMTNLLGMIIR